DTILVNTDNLPLFFFSTGAHMKSKSFLKNVIVFLLISLNTLISISRWWSKSKTGYELDLKPFSIVFNALSLFVMSFLALFLKQM
ncbi:hypothetical protein VIGAN_10144900, partial [Vigna angularis var. angularis]